MTDVRRKPRRLYATPVLLYIALGLIAIISLAPYYFTLVTALQPITWEPKGGAPPLLPDAFTPGNFVTAWERGRFGPALVNTMLLAASSAFARILGGAMAGYAFAKMSFPGQRWIFGALLFSLMIPTELTLVPSYLLFRNLGWVNTYLPFIVPGLGDVIALFFFRQFMQTLPTPMIEAARVDGASELRIFFGIVVPNCWPAIATLFIISFQTVYNDLQGPLIYLNDERLFTVQLQLKQFERVFTMGSAYDLVIQNAGSLIAAIPMIVIFIIFQRRIVEGIATTGVKG